MEGFPAGGRPRSSVIANHTPQARDVASGELVDPGVPPLTPPPRKRIGALMRRDAYSRAEAAFLIGVPLGWAVLLLFHPTGEGDYYPIVRDEVTAWLVVHLGTMLFIPLLATAVFVLLRGVAGVAARISRVALAAFAVVYSAYEVTVGIGSGILVDAINARPAAQRPAGAELLETYNESTVIAVLNIVGAVAWFVAAGAAGLALYRRAHTATSVAALTLFVVSAPAIAAHVTPYGPVGLTLFIVALVLIIRATPARPPSAPVAPLAGRPGAA
jgi:hypothetical protein